MTLKNIVILITISMLPLMAMPSTRTADDWDELYGQITLTEYIQIKTKMADIEKIIPIILKHEGGYVNHPLDNGNCTNKGVTLATYRYHFGKNKTCNDLKKITTEQWNYIFRKGYWDKIKGDDINNQSIANLLCDWQFNSGIYAIKFTQRILGVCDDGIVGDKTIAAINGYKNQKQLFEKMLARRKKHYDDIVRKNPSQKVFYRGWMNRLNSFKYFE